MIALKYAKTGRARFISHIDLLRHIVRTMRRAGIEVGFSQGFNPHMLLKLSSPLPLGISSEAEYFAADCKGINAEEFFDLYNRYCSNDLKGLRCWETDKNPNFQGEVDCADYYIPCDCKVDNIIAGILNSKTFVIEYLNKGRPESKEVRQLIKDIFADKGGFIMRLALGNITLRPDRMINNINRLYNLELLNTDIIRTAQYTIVNNQLISFDDLLDNIGV